MIFKPGDIVKLDLTDRNSYVDARVSIECGYYPAMTRKNDDCLEHTIKIPCSSCGLVLESAKTIRDLTQVLVETKLLFFYEEELVLVERSSQ